MKKVYVALLTVLVILTAFLVVQAQNNDQGPIATEATEIALNAIQTTPSAEETKDETNLNPDPEGIDDPDAKAVNDSELDEVDDSEDDQIVGSEDEPTGTPETEKDTDPEEEPTGTPEAEKDADPEEKPTGTSEAEKDADPEKEPTGTPEAEQTVDPESTPVTPVEPTAEVVPTETLTETPVPTESLIDTPVPTEEVVIDDHVYDEIIVKIKGSQVSVTYDGQRHQASGYQVTEINNGSYTENDFIFIGAATVELYDAGIAYMGLNDGMFVNKNNKFVNVYFEVEDGFIEIYPINVEIEITGNAETVEYNGETHSAYGYQFKQLRPEGVQVVTEESFGLRGDAEAYVENDKVGIYYMGLNNNSFENYNPNFNRVIFHVTDGYVEITPSEQSLLEEEMLLLEEELLKMEEELLKEESKNSEVTEPETKDDQEVTGNPEVKTGETENTTNEVDEPEKKDDQEVTGDPEVKTGEMADGQNPEDTAKTINLSAGTVILSSSEEDAEELLTLEEDGEFVILSINESGWVEIQLDGEAKGFVAVDPESLTEEKSDEVSDTNVDEGETKTLPVEENEEVKEEAAKILLPAGTVILSSSEEDAEEILTLEEDAEFVILSIDESGWVEIQLDGEAKGFVAVDPESLTEEKSDEASDKDADAKETDAKSAEVNDEVEEKVTKILLPAGTVILSAPEEDAEPLGMLEEDAELVVLSIDEFGWAAVQLDGETIGYIFGIEIPETETDKSEKNDNDKEKTELSITAGTVIRMNADGMSDIIYTAEEDVTVKILNVGADWIQVETSEGVVGFIFRGDVQFEEKDESTDKEAAEAETPARVLIFTSRRAIMDLGEEIKLTSLVEGLPEDIVLNYQWECNKGDGFEPVEGGNGDSYSYPATIESFTWAWRLIVSY